MLPVVPITPVNPLIACVPLVAPAEPAVPPSSLTAPANPVFVLIPGHNNTILDFSWSQDIKMYYQATSPLMAEDFLTGLHKW